MQNFIIDFMNNFGYLGITLLIALENVFPPIPSEVILGFGGFMTKVSNLSIVGVLLSSTLGSIIGAFVLYWIGKFLNKDKLIRIVNSRWGKFLFLKEKDIIKADKWFSSKGYKAIFFGRFVPVIRSLISIPAGMNKMNIQYFLIYTMLGSLIWNFVLTIIGSILGENWNILTGIIKKYSGIVLVFFLVLILIYLVKYKKNRN